MMKYCNALLFYIRTGIIVFIFCNYYLPGYAQYNAGKLIMDSALAVDANLQMTAAKKLQFFYRAKQYCDVHTLPEDSVYAFVLHKIGVYEFVVNNDINASIKSTLRALRINTAGNKNSSASFAINSYHNMGVYYEKLMLSGKALDYYDSSINAAKDNGYNYIIEERTSRAGIYFEMGDYQKCIEECIFGMQYCLKKNDSSTYLFLYNQKARSYLFQGQLQQAFADVQSIIHLAQNDSSSLAAAIKTNGFILVQQRRFTEAEVMFKRSIQITVASNDYGEAAAGYNDLGTLYVDSLRRYSAADKYFFKSIAFAKKNGDSVRSARAYLNLGLSSFRQKQYQDCGLYYSKALSFLKIAGNTTFTNPLTLKLSITNSKELVLIIMNNKTDLLLQLFKKYGDKKYLDACLQTALVTDTLITNIRHGQLGEQSKLYWRNQTREFFRNALDACCLANNTGLAFYFMEKSRSVLLNDNLNELGAAARLPNEDAVKEQGFKIKLVYQQQKLNALNQNSTDYKNQLQVLIQLKDELEHYTKSLEKKYPAYYLYKYADEAPSLKQLQQYLAVNKQSFIHYFMNDSLVCMLAITPVDARLIRVSEKDFDYGQLNRFMQFCTDKELLNSNYPAFAALSNSLYRALFRPLQIPAGRVVICPDNFLLPFEALVKDTVGKQFLLYDYMFSYVYSAGYLLKKFSNNTGVGNFTGFAPVAFKPYLNLADLKQSAASLEKSSGYYTNTRLFIHANATRKNFLEVIPGYTVVNVFSHARADTGDNEPLLYMQDSVIHLSELQLLTRPATRLVVLSACQTNVGRNAAGEGIYSLARGFASAGIPSVAATLWKADEAAIYAVTTKFHQLLAQGMRKDEALQKAKLFFIQQNDHDKMLPYYWANMIIMGNAEPVILSTHQRPVWWLIIAVVSLAVILLLVIIRVRVHHKNLLIESGK